MSVKGCRISFLFCSFAFLWSLKPIFVQASPSQGQQVLAKVGDREITEEEVFGRIRGQMLRIQNQLYSLKKQALDRLIGEYLLEEEARRRGLSKEELLRQEVDAKVGGVSDAEVEKYYQSNRHRLRKPLEQIKPQIVRYLNNRKKQERRDAFVQELRRVASVQVFLEPPIVEVAIDGAPVRGPAHAPITIVEFSDFQ